MAYIVHSDLWLCDDCTQAATYDDFSGLDNYSEAVAEQRRAVICEGIADLTKGTGYLCLNTGDEESEGYDEFSRRPCDCCCTKLAGSRTRFALLSH